MVTSFTKMFSRTSYILATPFVFVAGFLIRIVLFGNKDLVKILENRVEISTPVSSWKRAVEGVTLLNKNIDPYSGEVFHESPLTLDFYDHVLQSGQIAVIFSVCDLLTALLLAISASNYARDLVKVESKASKFPSSASCLLISSEQISFVAFYVIVIHLLNPFTIASCCGKSTATFLNCCLALFLLLLSSGHWFFGALVLGAISYHSLYYAGAIVPLILYIDKQTNSERKNTSGVVIRAIIAMIAFSATVGTLLWLSYKKMGSWDFVTSTYGFLLTVPDLTPNIGLFWYFFTEMFKHFRVFFLWTFQLNAFIYIIPLAIRLRGEPMLLSYIHLIIIALFKSYPCIGDVVLYLALLPMWRHLFLFMRQTLLVGCVLVSCTLLAPAFWHLWIYSGSANANFYFAITLVFNTGQIFLLTDILSAYIKREFYLQKGVQTDSEGKLLLMRLGN